MKSPLVSRRNKHPQKFGRKGVVDMKPGAFRVVHAFSFAPVQLVIQQVIR